MKKPLTLFLALIIFFCGFNSPEPIKAAAQGADVIYAYMPSAVTLYSKTDDGGYNPVTSLPPTYFLALLEDAESVSEYIKVTYADLTGYVKKSEIEICDYEPVTKHALGKAVMSFDGQPVNLRQTPDHTKKDNIISVIPPDGTVEYYGTSEGTALFEKLGNSWYYVRLIGEDETLYGYIYSAQVSTERISSNVIEKVVKPVPVPEPEPEITETPDTLSEMTIYIMIACLTVPAVLVMLLLFQKPPEKKRKPRHL